MGGLEGRRTGFRQLIGGQVSLVLLVAKVESLGDRLSKLLAIESAVAVLVGGLEARAEIRWHRAGLSADAYGTKGQGENQRSAEAFHKPSASRPPYPAKSRGSTSRRFSSFRRADDRRCRRSSPACRQS